MNIIDNMKSSMSKFIDDRQHYDSINTLRSNTTVLMPNGFRVFCEAEQKWYQMSCSNPNDPVTYEWTEELTDVRALVIDCGLFSQLPKTYTQEQAEEFYTIISSAVNADMKPIKSVYLKICTDDTSGAKVYQYYTTSITTRQTLVGESYIYSYNITSINKSIPGDVYVYILDIDDNESHNKSAVMRYDVFPDRGSSWFSGTSITGTSTEGTVFPSSGVDNAIVRDMYMNTSTSNVYTCVTEGTPNVAKWSYSGSIKGMKGDQGVQGVQGIQGLQGVSITNVEINEENHLILTLSDSTIIDAGEIINDETNYENLDNKPKINGIELIGNKSTSDLGIEIPTVTNDLTNVLKSNYDTAYTHSQSAHAPSNAEANVQSDWSETNNTSDSFIKNKPTSLPASDVSTWAKATNKPTYTASEVGLSNVPNVATNDQTPTYSEASTLETLTSGEKMSIAFGKIKKAITSLISHIGNKSNPHSVTKSQVGLGSVDNTSDASKPVSTATQTALNTKASTTTLTTHTGNADIHVTAADKTAWNDALISKADTTTVNNALALKANISDINTVTKDQGTKATYTEITAIPNATAGDVWYCTETGHYYRYTVGSTWADVGTGFDALNALENASGINYDNTETEISSTNIQGAVDEVSKGLVDVVLGDTVNIKKSLTWNNGWVNIYGVVSVSTRSQYSTPFLLKKGEVVSVTTNNKNICCIGTTTASTVTVGDTITTIKKTSSVDGSETYSYKAVEDINIVVCVLKSDYSVLFSLEDIYSRVDEQRDSRIVKDLLTKSRHGNCVTLLHFSDIHGDSKALTRIMDDYNNYYYGSVNGVICTGDIVANTYSRIDSWWDDRCMVCVGNHDTASYSSTYNWTALSMADRSAYYIEPFKSNWSVTHEIGKSYYYKDYTTQGQGIRLIVIDVMLYSSVNAEVEASIAQTTWLQGLLDSATSDELHVIICTHAPNGLSTSLSCGFSQYHVTDRIMPVEPTCTLPNTIVDMVRVAIDSGMNFVGYLCGHTHYDDIWVCASDTRQFMYCIGTSNISYKANWENTDLWRDVNNDVYNLVTINTTTKTVCLIRGGGANTDRLMRERKTICIDYKNAILVV